MSWVKIRTATSSPLRSHLTSERPGRTSRRSCRELVLGPVTDDLLTTPLATAQTAPSASRAVSVTQKVPPRRAD